MFKKILIGLLALVLVGGGVAWLNRKAIVLFVVGNTGKREVGPNISIPWKDGPSEASLAPDQRKPNIIFIVVDDLGYADLTSQGKGLLDGRVATPNIDRLAAEGTRFT